MRTIKGTKMQRRSSNDNGFTLIELMVVIAIIGILAGIASLSMDFIRRERVTSATRMLLADFQAVRVDGLTTGPTASTGSVPFMRGAGIRIESSTKYSLFLFNDCNENYTYEVDGCGGQREEARVDSKSLSGTLSIRINDLGTSPNNNILIFDRFGSPRAADWTEVSSMNIIITGPDISLRKCIMVGINKIREGLWDEASSTCKER